MFEADVDDVPPPTPPFVTGELGPSNEIWTSSVLMMSVAAAKDSSSS